LNHIADDRPTRKVRMPVPLLMRAARIVGWAGIAAMTVLSLVPGSERPHTNLPGMAEHFVAYACTGFALSLAYRGLREPPDFLGSSRGSQRRLRNPSDLDTRSGLRNRRCGGQHNRPNHWTPAWRSLPDCRRTPIGIISSLISLSSAPTVRKSSFIVLSQVWPASVTSTVVTIGGASGFALRPPAQYTPQESSPGPDCR
jgi:hypothetical protein